jgi:hypothetical protein
MLYDSKYINQTIIHIYQNFEMIIIDDCFVDDIIK